MSSSICLITTYTKRKYSSALQMKLITSWPAHKTFIPIAPISKKQKLKLSLLWQQERMLSKNFPMKLCRVFNKLVYLSVYVIHWTVFPLVSSPNVRLILYCVNYRKKRIKKQNQSTKESHLPLLACEVHLLQALETLSYLICPKSVWILPTKWRTVAPF